MIIDLLGCKLEDIIHASGKTGFGVENILQQLSKNSSPIRKC
jgi:GTP-binding protein LepA